jgi:ubiquinone/menaquinone biosynthesis C-methylase UbiE
LHAKVFDGEKERRKWQNPEAILTSIGLKSGFTFVDVGCGDGFFAVPAAKLVGKRGRVFGVDINPESIRRLEKKAESENLKNMELRLGRAEETVFCEGCADVVFFGIVLHDFDDPSKVLVNARKMLKRNGLLVNLDWKKEPMDVGPPLRIRFSEETAVRLIEAAGFKIETVKEWKPYNYIVIAA